MGCQGLAERIASRIVVPPELISELLPRLRTARGWSTSILSRMTVAPGEDPGIGEKTIQAIEANPGRVPEARILRALARALEVAPEEFYEWPIALVRETGAATPAAERRRAIDAARKAAQRRLDKQTTTPPDRARKRGKGQAA